MAPSYAVTRFDWPPVESRLEETPAGWRLSSLEVALEVDHQAGLRWLT
jgi:hypothetical protein